MPIGQHTKDISHLVDKVRQALGINAQVARPDNKKYEKQFPQQEQHVVHQSTSSQYHSPRKLIKQVALESPPNHFDVEDLGQMYKTIKIDNQSLYN